jgi:predicted Fe-Mo cluster-binding NifX family protein
MKWLVGLLIVCSSLFSDIIAVASDGDNLNSNISSKASRCNYYVFIDKNGKTLEILQNSHKDIKGGASSKLIEMLNRKKVSHFIASSFGEKLIISLDSNNIKYTIHKGDINTFIQQVIKK